MGAAIGRGSQIWQRQNNRALGLRHVILAFVAIAVALWLLHASTPLFERVARNRRWRRKSASLSRPGRARVANLVAQKATIERLARDSPSLGVDLLKTELAKLDALIGDFIDITLTAERCEQHAATFD